MTLSEVIAGVQASVIKVLGNPVMVEQFGVTRVYHLPTLEQTGAGKARKGKSVIYVLNEGVVAGPQVDGEGNPIYEQVPVNDGSGRTPDDPEWEPTYTDGDQVVVAEEDAEQAFLESAVALPRDKNDKGFAYLAGKVTDGTISGFEMTKSRPDLSVFSFFEVEVITPGGQPFEASRETWRVQEAPDGSPYHIKIV